MNLLQVDPVTRQSVHNQVQGAIRSGLLPKPTTQKCVRCGRQACDFHHPDYHWPLYVIALCRKCHTRLHAAYDLYQTKTAKNQALQDIIEKQKLTRTEFAEIIGVSANYVFQLLSGRRSISKGIVSRITTSFGRDSIRELEYE